MRSGLDRSAAAVAVLGLIGLAVSAYLTIVHYGGAPLACQQSSLVDCEAVTTSSYSLIPGTDLPITLAGLVWSAVVVGLGVAMLRGAGRGADIALLGWSGVAMLPVFYLVYAEIVVIQRICLWCTVFHAVILAALLVALARLQMASAEDDEAGEALT